MKVLISDSLSEKGIEILRREKDIDVQINTGLSHNQMLECIGE